MMPGQEPGSAQPGMMPQGGTPMMQGQPGMMRPGMMPMGAQPGGIGMMMNPALMEEHMMRMETHMANIEALLRQLVELQQKK